MVWGGGAPHTLTLVLLQDLKANESRLRDINKVASELESEGLMAEEAPMVQAQVSSPSPRRGPVLGARSPLMVCVVCSSSSRCRELLLDR